jgi:high-affinity iron transporter
MRVPFRPIALFACAMLMSTGAYSPSGYATKAYKKAAAAGVPSTNPKAGDDAAISEGQPLYADKCASCHGATGRGDGPDADGLSPKAANFADAERWKATNVGIKKWIILNGVAGTSMAATSLSDEQAWDILAWIQANITGG